MVLKDYEYHVFKDELILEKFLSDTEYKINIDKDFLDKINKAKHLNLKTVYISDRCFEEANIEEINLGDCVSGLGNFAFQGCRLLEKVNLSKSIKEIPKHCFDYCKSLEHINLENVEKLGESSFSHCPNLGNLNLDKINEIGRAAFFVSVVKDININNTFTALTQAFWFAHIKNLNISADIYAKDSIFNLAIIDNLKVRDILSHEKLFEKAEIENIEIEELKELKEDDFAECHLKNVKINKLKALETNAFNESIINNLTILGGFEIIRKNKYYVSDKTDVNLNIQFEILDENTNIHLDRLGIKTNKIYKEQDVLELEEEGYNFSQINQIISGYCLGLHLNNIPPTEDVSVFRGLKHLYKEKPEEFNKLSKEEIICIINKNFIKENER